MRSYFPNDDYKTPPDTKRALSDRILLDSRWPLYGMLLGAVLEARAASVKGIYDDTFWAESSYRVFRSIERCGGRFSITGFDIVRRIEPPVVFISNHMSTLETQVFPVLIVPFMPVTFVVKDQLVKGPLFGPIMRSRDPITVARKHPGEDLKRVLTGGVERLKKGVSIIVFPQSTRVTTFDERDFNTLGIKLARRAGVATVPVALKTDFWENGRILRGFGPKSRSRTIHFAFGEPIDPGINGKTAHRRIVDFISQKLDSWNDT